MPPRIYAVLGIVAGLSLAASLAGAQYTSKTAPFMANSVYKTLLNRNADAPSISAAAAEIQKGNLRSWVDSIVGSAEFKKAESGKSAADILNQIYQGLLGRDTDDKGRQAFLTQTGRKQYTDVVVSITESAEYQIRLNKLPQAR